MNEDTLVAILPVAHGRAWRWHADLNMVVLSDQLDEAGRQDALTECAAHWRRSCLRVVPNRAGVNSVTTDKVAR